MIPESLGGTNDFKNAIPLCFDCHADAGHYNAGHPRGTKFTPEQLRTQRDAWYEIVRSSHLDPAVPSPVHVRYLLCTNFELIKEIASGDFSALNVPAPLLVSSPSGRFIKGVVEKQPTGERPEEIPGAHFDSVEDYLKIHSSTVVRDHKEAFPYYEGVRVPSREELYQHLSHQDLVTRLLLDAGVDSSEVSYSLGWTVECRHGGFQETFHVRPFWALYLAVTNFELNPVTLLGLTYDDDSPGGLGYRPLWARQTQGVSSLEFPPAALAPKETAVIPLAALLGPLWPTDFKEIWTESRYLENGQGEDFSHGDLTEAVSGMSLIGPALWPRAISGIVDGGEFEQPIHDFDASNVYRQSRDWLIGSCPHLFFERTGGTLAYERSLFAFGEGEQEEHEIVVPSGCVGIHIAELEEEVTYIEFVKVNGVRKLEHLTLQKGDSFSLAALPGDRLLVRGRYETSYPSRLEAWRRNELIYIFTHRMMPPNCPVQPTARWAAAGRPGVTLCGL